MESKPQANQDRLAKMKKMQEDAKKMAEKLMKAEEAKAQQKPKVFSKDQPKKVVKEEAKGQTPENMSKAVVARPAKVFGMDMIKEDHQCCICQEIMVEPCKMPCGHYFCCQCIKWQFQTKHQCALCRKVPPKNFEITVDKKFQEYLQQAHTDEYNIMHAHLVQAGMLNDEIFGV